MADFGESNFGQSILVLCLLLVLLVLGVGCWVLVLVLVLVWLLVLWTLRFSLAPDPPSLDHPTPDPPKISLSFFPLSPPSHFRSFCLSLWVSSR